MCTDLIFAYLLVWDRSNVQLYNHELGAMILSSNWLSTLALMCPGGCVVIMTNRVLDPNNRWKLLDRMEVKNPCLWDSVGYNSILEKSNPKLILVKVLLFRGLDWVYHRPLQS